MTFQRISTEVIFSHFISSVGLFAVAISSETNKQYLRNLCDAVEKFSFFVSIK